MEIDVSVPWHIISPNKGVQISHGNFFFWNRKKPFFQTIQSISQNTRSQSINSRANRGPNSKSEEATTSTALSDAGIYTHIQPFNYCLLHKQVFLFGWLVFLPPLEKWKEKKEKMEKKNSYSSDRPPRRTRASLTVALSLSWASHIVTTSANIAVKQQYTNSFKTFLPIIYKVLLQYTGIIKLDHICHVVSKTYNLTKCKYEY